MIEFQVGDEVVLKKSRKRDLIAGLTWGRVGVVVHNPTNAFPDGRPEDGDDGWVWVDFDGHLESIWNLELQLNVSDQDVDAAIQSILGRAT